MFIVTLTHGVGHFQASFCRSSDLINILTRVISISMFFKKLHGGIQRFVKIHSMHSNLEMAW